MKKRRLRAAERQTWMSTNQTFRFCSPMSFSCLNVGNIPACPAFSEVYRPAPLAVLLSVGLQDFSAFVFVENKLHLPSPPPDVQGSTVALQGL